MILHIDFETCCHEDLRRVGADVYSRSPTLTVTVIAWAFDNEPVKSTVYPSTTKLPNEVLFYLGAGGKFKAWNAAFEWSILTNHYGLALKRDQSVCTMQAALHSGLPAALAEAGPALGTNIVKDTSAHSLMMRMARPRAYDPVKKTYTYWHEDEPARLNALKDYCVADVEAEREIALMIAPLPTIEQKISALDMAANQQGVRIDFRLVNALKTLAKYEIDALNDECRTLTQGEITSPGTQVAKLLAWLRPRLAPKPVDDLSKDNVTALLDCYGTEWTGPRVRRVLEIRQMISKSSLKKLDAMTRCAGPGDRVRQQLAYYGASRTGRFAGRLIQPQNFPRPLIKSVDEFIEYATDGADPEWLRLTYGPLLDGIASSLRGCLVPAPGNVFIAYDLSQIEARVVAWLAGQQDALDVFESGQDIYVHAAKKIRSDSRLLGKVITLACGFGMGPDKFQGTALTHGLRLDSAQCTAAVQGWREANPKIVALWRLTSDRVKDLLAEGKPGTMKINGKLSATLSRSKLGRPLLTLLLPSGRRLYYRDARVEMDNSPRGYGLQIVYSGTHQTTRQWTDIRTYGGKLVENVVQAIARDVIVEAGLRIDARSLGELVLSVHDELLFEAPESEAHDMAREIQREINTRPSWALDLPVASSGGILTRYGKV